MNLAIILLIALPKPCWLIPNKIDLRLSTLKPIHAKTVLKVYEHLKSDEGKQVILNEFRAAGITEAVKKMRKNPKIWT